MDRVLIVDDERSIRRSLGAVLEAEGYSVEAAADAQTALTLLSSKPFDVVISDIVLPGLNGIELLEAIGEAVPCVQVIMMTGVPTVDTAAEALRLGAFDYLTKPVIKNAILRSVGNASKVKRAEDEQRRLHAENRQYQENLEGLVEERTHELTGVNRDLASALENVRRMQLQVIRQERLNALGQMVSGIAHDFNNQLMPILGLSEFLISEEDVLNDKEETREILRTIVSAAKDACEIVRRLREFYKPGISQEMTTVDLRALCAEALTLTRPKWKVQAEAADCIISARSQIEGSPVVEANGQQIKEVLCNLIINACDAMPEGGTLTLSCEIKGDKVMLRVTDTGTGMSEEEQKRCLEPFFTTKGERGSGLGLSTCHGIISRHGGEMQIQSTPGGGTTMTLVLPVRQEQPSRGDGNHTDTPPMVPVTGLRICVVDDEEPSRMLLKKYLERVGHTVETVNCAEQALACVVSGSVDILLTDRAMPGMGGDALAKAVKSSTHPVPVIMVTGFGDLMEEKKEIPEGVDRVVSKPVTIGEVRDAVSRVWSACGAQVGGANHG